MKDFYQSNRDQAAKYHKKICTKLEFLVAWGDQAAFAPKDPQPFYLEFKQKLQTLVDRETESQKKDLERSDNSHLLLLKRTALVDAVVQTSFRMALSLFNRTQKSPLKENSLPIALVACGGYGREEMYFRSDVDLQIIIRTGLKGEEEKQTHKVINLFNYLFVYQEIFPTSSSTGFSEINTENVEFDQNRLTSFYSMMEHRFVAGNPVTYNEFKSSIKTAALLHKDRIVRECFKQKSNFEIQNTVFRQEPNIKEELRRLYWATSLVRIRKSLEKTNQFEMLFELYQRQMLSPPAFKKMQSALSFLSRVRMFLHCHQKGSHRDLMGYEVREKIAESMGYKKDVRGFFKDYFYQSVLPLKRLSRNLFWETMSFPSSKSKKLSEHFALNSENQIIFTKDPEEHSFGSMASILELFAWVAKRNYFLSYPVIRSIESNADSSTPLFQGNGDLAEVQSYFHSIVRGKYFSKAIRYLHEFGLLEQYFIPEFKNLSGLLQDIYVHLFPTDIHVLAALDALNLFETDPEADSFLVDLYQSLKDKTTLKLAVTLHDIGKGLKAPGENEELVGARAVPRILKNLGYERNPKLIGDVAFLVEKHLMMGDLMLLDPDEDDTYEMIWDLVEKDVERLKMLILLTYADRAGTKMKMSKSQVDQLKYFYQNTLHHKKQRSVSQPVQMEFMKMIRLPRDLQAQLQIYDKFKKSSDGLATELFFRAEGPSELVVCTKDQPGLLYKIATCLAFNQVSIADANIHTLNGNVFDVFKVCDLEGRPIAFSNFSYVRDRIIEDLGKIFSGDLPVSSLYKGRSLSTGAMQGRYKDIKLKVSIIGRAVKVETHDTIGTTMMETKVFSQLGLEIQRAVIHTNYGTASNVYYLKPDDVHKIIREEAKFKNLMKQALTPLIRPEPIFPGEPAEVA
jgi:[protein-PII] uridylyltransferase